MKLKISDEVRKLMPEFFARIENYDIYHYDEAGFTRELTDEDKARIKELKEKYKFNTVAVIETEVVFADGETAHMLSYVDVENYPPIAMKDGAGVKYILCEAFVVNKSWDIEEMGSIGLIEKKGCVFRIY